ncbi:DUF1168-domain-containing protein [Meira miltonrushii]|uniref:DUF1168-domain-containing protein n=1 Tax=Meira miltonrushii TaxID=1280837 RepID=A0A316VJY8_9BASI|nr:DUF1168-domain-containing protein [Meira miltonrushii]PWN37544.1 DUF1168-domain-containing protein [Meira miltonrushii]
MSNTSDHRTFIKQTASTAHEQQAAKLEKLLANPDKPIALPPLQHEKTLRPPREIMKNVSGSSAGAGSGEFHVYKHSRRREYERIKLMEEAAEKEKEEKEYQNRQKEVQLAIERKTNKNRAKRDKRKAARGAAKSANQTDINKHIDEEILESTNEKRRRLHAEGASEVIFQQPESDSKG